MSFGTFTESVVDQVALAWLEAIGWRIAPGRDIGFDTPAAERADDGEVVLALRLRDAVARLNPALRAEVREDGRCWSRHLLRGGAVMIASLALGLRRVANRAMNQAVLARYAPQRQHEPVIGPFIGPSWPDSVDWIS